MCRSQEFSLKFNLMLGVALALAAGCGAPEEPPAPLRGFESHFVTTQLESIFNIDDAGVGDLNADGHLDLWTTNHSALQWIALGASDGRFVPHGVDELNLHQDVRIPGMEASFDQPKCSGEVQQIFIQGSTAVIKNNMSARTQIFQGRLHMPWPSRPIISRGASWHTLDCPSRVQCTNGWFEIAPDSDLRLETIPDQSDGFPISVTLDPETVLSNVRLGGSCFTPNDHNIEFTLKDRHGLVLADFAGSVAADIFVSRGGARGRLNDVHPGALDEFFVWNDGTFTEQIEHTGITKNGCPGRQIGAIDIDQDGDLDIYQVCGRGSGDSASAANRLYIQTGRGTFEERANAWGLALDGAGSFAWVPQADPANKPRFVWVTSELVLVFEHVGGRYVERWRSLNTADHEPALLVGDIDADGHFEVAVLSHRGNAMLKLAPENFSITPFAELGLPEGSIAGNFVDFDGDRRLDLFLVPQGLYQLENGTWQETRLLVLESANDIRQAHSSWFDADGDGDLDLWLTLRDYEVSPSALHWVPEFLRTKSGTSRVWQSYLFEQKTERPTHGLVRVVGRAGNHEAVGAIVVAIGNGQTSRMIVGHSDGSRLSQTLYNAYLGISGLEKLDLLTAIFPDGETVSVRDVKTTSMPVLTHPQAQRLLSEQH